MAVGARNNAFGTFQYRFDFVVTTTTILNNGTKTVSQSASSNGEHTCIRANHSVRKPTQLGTTSTYWRKASSYERHVVNYKSIEGVWKDNSFTGTNPTSIASKTVEGCPRNGASWRMLDCPPMWEGGANAIWDTNEVARATTECLNKLAGEKTNLLTSLAEARQTADMLATRSIQLYQMLRAAKRGRWAELKRLGFGAITPRKLANTHLEVKYGWIPLMKDIYGTYELLRNQMEPAHIVQAKRFVTTNADARPSGTKWTSTGGAKASYGCVLWGMLDDSYARHVNQAGLMNPASLAWEVVPLSFVVDWGLPLGNVFSALTATKGLKFVSGYQSVRMEANVTATLKPTGNYEEVSPRQIEAECFSYRRKQLTAFPAPQVYAKSPFSTPNVETAAALLGQRNLK